MNYPAGRSEVHLRGLMEVEHSSTREGGFYTSQPGISIPGFSLLDYFSVQPFQNPRVELPGVLRVRQKHRVIEYFQPRAGIHRQPFG